MNLSYVEDLEETVKRLRGANPAPSDVMLYIAQSSKVINELISHAKQQKKVIAEWEELWAPIRKLMQPYTPLGACITDITVELIKKGLAAQPNSAAVEPDYKALCNELVSALTNLEVSANTIAACYERRPENFAMALQRLAHDAKIAREAIAKASASTDRRV